MSEGKKSKLFSVAKIGLGMAAWATSLMAIFIPLLSDYGIWMGSPGNLTLVAFEGQRATDPFGPNLYFGDFNGLLRINDAGEVAFSTKLTGPGVLPNNNDYAIFAGAPDELEMVMRQGDAAPDCPDAVCVLSPTQALPDIDRKAERFCRACWNRLSSGTMRI